MTLVRATLLSHTRWTVGSGHGELDQILGSIRTESLF